MGLFDFFGVKKSTGFPVGASVLTFFLPPNYRPTVRMPPKKKVEEEKVILLGRMGTNLKIGIVGLPNVGKSTFFNVLTKTSIAAAENFPFCTIDPNESRCPVPDERYDWLCDHWKPASKVPAFLNVVDIAGLVKGASEGQGLGNAFLGNISACDAIFHVTRAFEDEDITHVEGGVDPVRDLAIIAEELRLKDIEYIDKQLASMEKTVVRGGDKAREFEYKTLVKVADHLKDTESGPGRWIRYGDWNGKELEAINPHLFITAKPVIYLINLSEKDYIKKKNKWLAKIVGWIKENDPGALAIPFSGILEHKLFEMEPDEQNAYAEANPGAKSSLEKIIVQGYKALGLMYFFTAGEDEVKAWTIQKHTKAPQAAGKIHTDFEKGFIMAEVMKFADYKEHGSEAGVRGAGGYRQQGKEYVVEDGDIIFFKFNAGAGLKKK